MYKGINNSYLENIDISVYFEVANFILEEISYNCRISYKKGIFLWGYL